MLQKHHRHRASYQYFWNPSELPCHPLIPWKSTVPSHLPPAASKYHLVAGFPGIWLAATSSVDCVDYKAAARSWLRVSLLKFLSPTARLPLALQFIRESARPRSPALVVNGAGQSVASSSGQHWPQSGEGEGHSAISISVYQWKKKKERG